MNYYFHNIHSLLSLLYTSFICLDLARPLISLPIRGHSFDVIPNQYSAVEIDSQKSTELLTRPQADRQTISKRPSFQFHEKARGRGSASADSLTNIPVPVRFVEPSSSSRSQIEEIDGDNRITFRQEEINLNERKSSCFAENDTKNDKIYQNQTMAVDTVELERNTMKKSTGKRNLSPEREAKNFHHEPLSKSAKILRASKIPKKRLSLGKTYSTRQESSHLLKVLKRERKPSFKLMD